MLATIRSALSQLLRRPAEFSGERRHHARADMGGRPATIGLRATDATVGSIFFGDAKRRAVIRNISSGGLMLETTSPPEVEEQVMVKIAGVAPIGGTVLWRKDDKVGIGFDDVLSPEELALVARDPN